MKLSTKAYLLAALAISTIGLGMMTAGCQTSTVQTPAQIAAQVCPPAQAALAVLQTPGNTLSATAQSDLAKVAPMVAAVCSGAATVSTTSLQSLLSSGMPLLISILQVAGVSTAAPIMGDLVLAISVLEAIMGSTGVATPPPAVASSKLGNPYVCYTLASGKVPVCQ